MEHYLNNDETKSGWQRKRQNAPVEEQLDLHGILSIVKRHRKIVYYTLCLAIILAVLVNLLPPTYEARVVIRVVPSAKALTDMTVASWSSEELARQKMYTYAELIRSRTVVEAMLDKVNPGRKDALTYEKVIGRISVRPLKDTEILNVFVSADTPEEAQMLVNALAVAFNERLVDIVRAEGKEARIFIGERFAEVKRDLDTAEKALSEYKKANRVIAISEQTKSFVERQAIIKKLEAENRLALEAARTKVRNTSVIQDTPALAQYRIRLMEAETELAGVLKNYTEQHPRVKALRASIVDNQNMINAELARIAAGEISLSETQQSALHHINSQAELEAANLPATETKVARLMLDYSVAEGLYTMLAKRYEDSRISEIKESTNVQIIDMAYLPGSPVKPRKHLNLAIAAVLGLFTGTMLTFVAEYFFKTIDTAEDVRRYLNLRVIGSIPQTAPKPGWKVWQTNKRMNL